MKEIVVHFIEFTATNVTMYERSTLTHGGAQTVEQLFLRDVIRWVFI
jgi:hypothetical protein